jgi:sulfotransferase
MEKAFQGFCKAGLYGYFDAITDRPYVIDKSRAWTGNFRFANFIEPKPKSNCNGSRFERYICFYGKKLQKKPT